ncbi:MAG: VOC family protein, partial [Pseudomonadota bacterium]
PIVHFEIGCTDTVETKAFLQGLFDWEFDGPESGPTIETGSSSGLHGHLVALAPEWGPYVTVYVQVDDLVESVAKARSLGGKVLVEPVAIPGQGRFAWITPPEGQIIGLWEVETGR